MPKSKETILNRYFLSSSSTGIRSYFGIVDRGQSEVYETPFAKGESTENLLDNWISRLESIKQEWPGLFEFEIDLAKKVGPMSVMKPLEERLADVDHYYEDILHPSEPILDSAISAVRKEWASVSGLRLRSQEATVAKMKTSTNSGTPFFTKRRNVVSQTLPSIISHSGNDVFETLPSGRTTQVAAILGWRGQEGGRNPDDVKQRVVWMFPFGVNIRELQLYQPMIEAAQNFDLVPAWVGMERVDAEITKMFDSKHPNDLIVCTDFSRFDQHFNPSLQQAASKLLAALLTPNADSLAWMREIFPIKYMIPIILNESMVKYGMHGMASGSGGTNADETLAHRCLQYESAQKHGAMLNTHSQCLGDDGILTYPGINVEDVVDSYSSHGQTMNLDKQYASTEDCVYLRRWHHRDYRVDGVCAGVYSTCRALGRLRYVERYYDPEVWGPRMVALRQLSILENVKNHPLKVEFVNYCMERDKYRLGLDIPGFLDELELCVQSAIDSMPDFIGYARSVGSSEINFYGINSWWVVNYLKSLR